MIVLKNTQRRIHLLSTNRNSPTADCLGIILTTRQTVRHFC